MFEVYVDTATGKFAAAESLLRQAQGLYDTLAAHDASNLRWRFASLNARLIQAMLARQRGDPADAGRLVDDALPQLEAVSATEPSDRSIALRLATVWRLRAQLQPRASQQAAATAATHAVAIGERLLRDGRATDADVGECATAYVVSGEIASLLGDTAEARHDWLRAAEMLAPRTGRGRDWRLLDPGARAAAWMGRSDEARAAIRQLNLIGYVPLDPWPNPDLAAAVKSPDPQLK